MRRVRYGVGMSLDGFIADAGGGTSFLVSDPTYDSAPFFASIDTVLMGRVTYEEAVRQGMRAYPGLRNYVVSRTLRPESFPEVTMLGQGAERAIAELRSGPGKDIWLCGGGVLLRNLLAAGSGRHGGTRREPIAAWAIRNTMDFAHLAARRRHTARPHAEHRAAQRLTDTRVRGATSRRGLKPMTSTSDRRGVFRRLHEAGCFVMPNPWDLGSAHVLAQLGFPALATTSAGFAWSLGKPDNGVTLAEALTHMRAIAERVDIPVNADFEGGFAIEPEAVGVNVASAATTGVAGLSIEDSTGDPMSPLFDFALSVERVRAARARTRQERELRMCSPPVPKASSSGGRTWTKPSAALSVRRGRRRLPLRARYSNQRGHRRRCAGRRAQASERAGGQRLHDREGPRRARRSAHQRRRCPGPRGVGRLSDSGGRDRRARDIHRPGHCDAVCGTESALRRTCSTSLVRT